MNKFQYQKLQSKAKIIESDLSNKSDRILLYGIICLNKKRFVFNENRSKHLLVYIQNCIIHTVAYDEWKNREEIEVNSNEDYVQLHEDESFVAGRLDSDLCDYEFCSLLRMREIELAFAFYAEKQEIRERLKISDPEFSFITTQLNEAFDQIQKETLNERPNIDKPEIKPGPTISIQNPEQTKSSFSERSESNNASLHLAAEYSEKERKLISHFIDPSLMNHLTPSVIYKMCVEEAFQNGENENCYAKSLRNCVKAFQQSKIYRLTKEWDDLIQLDETFMEFSKEVLELNNWFIAHQLSAYQKADATTKAHLDNLYLEFNKTWKELLKKYKVKE